MATPRSYEIRSLRPRDYPSFRPVVLLAIGALERSTGIDEGSEATVELLSRRSVWFLLRLFRLLRHPIWDPVVAVEGSEVVSTGTILWLPHTAYVTGVATRPERRGQGFASKVLADLTERAERHHRPWIALDVESENRTAISVYRKAGYREAGAFTWYTRRGPAPASSAVPESVGPVEPSEWRRLTPRLDAGRPTSLEWRTSVVTCPRSSPASATTSRASKPLLLNSR